jgi:hypothetical protein
VKVNDTEDGSYAFKADEVKHEGTSLDDRPLRRHGGSG